MPNLGAPGSSTPKTREAQARKRLSVTRQQSGVTTATAAVYNTAGETIDESQQKVNDFLKKLVKLDADAHAAALKCPPISSSSSSSSAYNNNASNANNNNNANGKMHGAEGSKAALNKRVTKTQSELQAIRKKGLAVRYNQQFTRLASEQAKLQAELKEFEEALMELRAKRNAPRMDRSNQDTDHGMEEEAKEKFAASMEQFQRLESELLNKEDLLKAKINANNEKLCQMYISNDTSEDLERAVNRGKQSGLDEELSAVDTSTSTPDQTQTSGLLSPIKENTWMEFYNEAYQRPYYYNPTSGEVVWELPEEDSMEIRPGPAPPAGSPVISSSHSITLESPSLHRLTSCGGSVSGLSTEDTTVVKDFTRRSSYSVSDARSVVSTTNSITSSIQKTLPQNDAERRALRRRSTLNRQRRRKKQRNRRIIVVSLIAAILVFLLYRSYKASQDVKFEAEAQAKLEAELKAREEAQTKLEAQAARLEQLRIEQEERALQEKKEAAARRKRKAELLKAKKKKEEEEEAQRKKLEEERQAQLRREMDAEAARLDMERLRKIQEQIERERKIEQERERKLQKELEEKQLAEELARQKAHDEEMRRMKEAAQEAQRKAHQAALEAQRLREEIEREIAEKERQEYIKESRRQFEEEQRKSKEREVKQAQELANAYNAVLSAGDWMNMGADEVVMERSRQLVLQDLAKKEEEAIAEFWTHTQGLQLL